jgi:Flp pilus assembly protein TadB
MFPLLRLEGQLSIVVREPVRRPQPRTTRLSSGPVTGWSKASGAGSGIHEYSIVMVLCLCALARLEYAMGRPWWMIVITLALVVGLLWCEWSITRELRRRAL